MTGSHRASTCGTLLVARGMSQLSDTICKSVRLAIKLCSSAESAGCSHLWRNEGLPFGPARANAAAGDAVSGPEMDGVAERQTSSTAGENETFELVCCAAGRPADVLHRCCRLRCSLRQLCWDSAFLGIRKAFSSSRASCSVLRRASPTAMEPPSGRQRAQLDPASCIRARRRTAACHSLHPTPSRDFVECSKPADGME